MTEKGKYLGTRLFRVSRISCTDVKHVNKISVTEKNIYRSLSYLALPPLASDPYCPIAIIPDRGATAN